MKYDGYRIGCAVEGRAATLWSRRGKDWTAQFPEVAAAATSGKWAVQSLPRRLHSVARPSAMAQPIRYPSYFTSCTHASPAGASSTRSASWAR